MSIQRRWTLSLLAVVTSLVVAVTAALEWQAHRERARVESTWQASRLSELDVRLQLSGGASLRTVGDLVGSGDIESLVAPYVGGRSTSDRDLVDWAAGCAARWGLDQVVLLDSAGNVLSNARWPEAYGRPHPQVDFLLNRLTRDPVVWESAEPDPVRMVGSIQSVRVGTSLFRVLGGVVLSEQLRTIGRESGFDALRVTPLGQPMSTGEIEVDIPLDWQMQGEWRLHAALPAAPGLATLEALRRRWRVIAVVVLLLTILTVPLVARGLSKPLIELTRATTDIGLGNRQPQLPSSNVREIQELARALGEMAEDLGESEARIRAAERRGAWREIARRIAHEIKNALSPLALALDNIETATARADDRGREASARAIDTARDQLNSLDRLVGEFRSFARMPRLHLATYEVWSMISSAVSSAAEVHSSVQFKVCDEVRLPLVHGDAEQMRRALLNLLLNAAEAGSAAIEVVADVGPGDHRWWLAVRDDGPGLPVSVGADFGTPYLTTKPGGTGLGVAVVRQTCEAHGGAFRWRALDPKGLEVRLELPVIAQVQSEDDEGDAIV